MSTFGVIKTNIENTAVELSKKPSFKRFIFEFETLVLNNKDISELYYIYDDLSSNKGVPSDIANDYINESIKYSQILIESQTKSLSKLNEWITGWNDNRSNNYTDIDNAIYNTSIKNLESILESKKNIQRVLTESPKRKEIKENLNLPLNTMLKVANTTLSNNFSDIQESERNELSEIISMDYNVLKKEMDILKEDVVVKLKNNLNESKEDGLEDSIKNTIDKIMDAKCTHYDFYKLKKLSLGL
jgi:hypothetical protein